MLCVKFMCKGSFFNFVYGLTDEAFSLEDAIWDLKNWALSGIDWPVYNSQRIDVRLNPEAPQIDRVGIGSVSK